MSIRVYQHTTYTTRNDSQLTKIVAKMSSSEFKGLLLSAFHQRDESWARQTNTLAPILSQFYSDSPTELSQRTLNVAVGLLSRANLNAPMDGSRYYTRVKFYIKPRPWVPLSPRTFANFCEILLPLYTDQFCASRRLDLTHNYASYVGFQARPSLARPQATHAQDLSSVSSSA